MAFSLIAVPGRGHYSLYADEGVKGDPSLLRVTDPDTIAYYKEMYSIAIVEAQEVPGRPLEEDRRPCPVELFGEGRPVLVFGEELPAIRGVAYLAVARLVQQYPHGATRAELNRVADTKNVTTALSALATRDERWRAVLRFPRGVGDSRGSGGMYRLCDSRLSQDSVSA